MNHWIIDIPIFLGSALMVYNICGFVRFSREVRLRETEISNEQHAILDVPIVLLVLFFIGYMIVGLFGKPDLVMAGILFGGSIFVYIMYRLLDSITKRIIEQEKLKAELQAAEESTRMKAELLASVSHEMRTPMNIIMGLDTLALKNPNLPAETRDQLEKIGRSGEHLIGLINNILDLNSIEKGELAAEAELFTLSDVLCQVNAMMATLCEEKGLTYKTSVDENARGRYLGDEMMLKQVLLGVLDNAVKYTDVPGTVTLDVRAVPAEGPTRRIRFTVRDTGIGIDPAFLPKLFDLFAQEDSSSTSRFGGSGLGLPLVKKKLELLGGEILVESEKGKGSVFTITVPLTPTEEPQQEQNESAAPQQHASEEAGNPGAGAAAEEPEGTELLPGYRIMVAEDIPENAEIVQDLLELEGAETDHAENGKIALDMFSGTEEYYYDAILMDLRMPVMDGLEATRQIRALERKDAKSVPILALTANVSEEDIRNSREAGMDAHLGKPTDADALYAALRERIQRFRRERVVEA